LDKATSSASTRVKRYTQSSSRRRQPNTMVCFRLPHSVLDFLQENVPNVSGTCRKLVFDYVEQLPGYWIVEEFRLEVEVARLIDELEDLHRWQNAVLKHGSYAEAYLQKLKGGIVQDRKPFNVREPAPEVKVEEKKLVEKIVALREAIAVELTEKLNRLVELKGGRIHGNVTDNSQGR
jgi:hypothetical protein